MDYRQLSAVTCKDSYLLIHIDDSLDSLGTAKYFSTGLGQRLLASWSHRVSPCHIPMINREGP